MPPPSPFFNMGSARVSSPQERKKADGGSKGEASNADEDDDGDGALCGGPKGMVGVAGASGRPCYTLFIDGIADSVEYSQVRDLFSQHGRLRNVFIQRKRRSGRKFRFGFVRYDKKEDAVRALELLDGVRLGGAYLSVKPEISAGKVGILRRWRRDLEVVPTVAIAALVQKRQCASRGPYPAIRSWSEIVKGGSMVRPSLDSEFLTDGVGGCGLWPQRLPDEVLFPETVSLRGSGVDSVLCVQDEVLFPELAIGIGLVMLMPEDAEGDGSAVEEEAQAVEEEELEVIGRGGCLLPCSGRDAFVHRDDVVAKDDGGGELQMMEVDGPGWAHAVMPWGAKEACAFLDGDAQRVEHKVAGFQCWATKDLGIVQEYEGETHLNNEFVIPDTVSTSGARQIDVVLKEKDREVKYINNTGPIIPLAHVQAGVAQFPTLDEIDMRAGNRRQRAQEVIRSINRSLAASQIVNGRGSSCARDVLRSDGIVP